MGISIINGGLWTTVQDKGRIGYQSTGFSESGVMDYDSYRIANLLLDNDENDAVLEFILTGPTIKFTSDAMIAITGGDFQPTINGLPVDMYRALYVKRNDVLALPYAVSGNYGYIAFNEKLYIKDFMGSKSTNTKCKIGGYKGRTLKRGDAIGFEKKCKYDPMIFARSLPKISFENEVPELRVVLGPQENAFTDQALHTFLNSEYALTNQCDRMGYRLEGPKIKHKVKADIISDGIAFGSIQVPSHGNPIVMLADRQTTGGYTKIATVISTDIPKLVQLRETDKVKFKQVSVEQAQEILREREVTFREYKYILDEQSENMTFARRTAHRIMSLYRK